jgi:hypothetical protein
MGVLNVAGGPIAEIARQSPVFRGLAVNQLRRRRGSIVAIGLAGAPEPEAFPYGVMGDEHGRALPAPRCDCEEPSASAASPCDGPRERAP